MSRTVMIVALLTSLCTGAMADVYVEVDFAGGFPSGGTDPSLIFGEQTALSVYIWADDPGAIISGFTLDLNGESQMGQLGSGGIFEFTSLGTPDPDDLFLFEFPGEQTSSTYIDGIFMSNLALPGVELPVGTSAALEVYAGFTGSAQSVGAGVMPDALIEWAPGTAPQTVHTFGIYQTPTPGTLGMIGICMLMRTRRRRNS